MLTVPSLILLIALMALAVDRLISPAVLARFLMVDFISVVSLLPYFARLRSASLGTKPAPNNARRQP